MSRVSAAIKRAHGQMDTEWRRLLNTNQLLNQTGDGLDIACGKGCAGCCTYVVNILDVEATHVVDLIQSWPPGARAQAIARIQAAYVEWQRFIKANPMPSNTADHQWRARWQIRQQPCPLLDLDTQACMIYADRPATCRAHHAAFPKPQHLRERPDVRIPPVGCMFQPGDEDRPERPVLKIQAASNERFAQFAIQSLEGDGLHWRTGVLIPLLMQEGHKRYGWGVRGHHPGQHRPAASVTGGQPT